MAANPHRRLTALRTLNLLRDTETGSDQWKATAVRNALADHLRHLIVAKQKRKPRAKLRAVTPIREAK